MPEDKIREMLAKYAPELITRVIASRKPEYPVSTYDDYQRMMRQRYAESSFDDHAKSEAGAMGAYQIMPITLRDYLGRGKGKPGDLYDPVYNQKVRDFALGMVPRDLGKYWSEDDPDIVNLAKQYAGYNWGAGSLRNYLRKQQAAGVDINGGLDWVAGMPKETRDYVNFVVLGNDVPGTGKTMEQFDTALADFNSRASGGKIHIKPENRGKFTALKERTGHSASWFKAHGTPSQKKMATFALNARKWKHADGGILERLDSAYGGDTAAMLEMIQRVKAKRNA